MATKETIKSLLKEIQAAYPAWKADEGTIQVYAIYMADLPDELLTASVRSFISSSTHAFPPSIPELRSKATELVAETNGIPSALEAWDEVRSAPKPRDPRYPLYRGGERVIEEPHKWSHPIVRTCALRFGWPDFPSDENEMADRSHFMKAYDLMRGEEMRAATRLPQISQYIQEQQMLQKAEERLQLAERSSVFETGERAEIARLTRSMEL